MRKYIDIINESQFEDVEKIDAMADDMQEEPLTDGTPEEETKVEIQPERRHPRRLK